MKKAILSLSTLAIFFTIGFTACEKIEKDTPQAIKKLIREKGKHGGQVIEYEYNHEYVYCWDDHCYDGFIICYNEKGKELWLSGGLDGLGDGKCPEDFFDKAIFKRIIWTSNKTKKQVVWIQ